MYLIFVDKQDLAEVENACPRFSTFFMILEIILKRKVPGFYKRTNFVFQISQNFK